jgi:hypothetical protein
MISPKSHWLDHDETATLLLGLDGVAVATAEPSEDGWLVVALLNGM